MSEVKIEIAEIKDVADIAEISYQSGKKHEETMPNYFKQSNAKAQQKFLKEAVESQYSQVFKAVVDNKIVGYLVLYIWDQPQEYFVNTQFGYIGSLGVDANYQNQGIGTKLIKIAENWCLEHNINEIGLDVFDFNTRAALLYERLGYDNLKHRRIKFLK